MLTNHIPCLLTKKLLSKTAVILTALIPIVTTPSDTSVFEDLICGDEFNFSYGLSQSVIQQAAVFVNLWFTQRQYLHDKITV
jgi:hypothetical protein